MRRWSKQDYSKDEDMADLSILVKDVSSDEESDDDQCSYHSTSSAGSYDDELKALYDDRDSSTR